MAHFKEKPDTVPVVICDDDGPTDLARQNRKAFEKSIEQGHLWVVTTNDRVLPYSDDRPVALEARGSWNLARLSSGRAEASSGRSSRRAETRSQSATGEPGSDQIGGVLTALAALIAERQRELPEGSYTTHLFSSGGEKIRKKLGEEAVELILAPDNRLVSETSDLIYHLLVLLASEGITLDQIAAELSTR